jgi:hypothetical protein
MQSQVTDTASTLTAMLFRTLPHTTRIHRWLANCHRARNSPSARASCKAAVESSYVRPLIYEESSVKTGARRSRDFPHIDSAPCAVAERDEGACAFCDASLSVTQLCGRSMRASVVHHRRILGGSPAARLEGIPRLDSATTLTMQAQRVSAIPTNGRSMRDQIPNALSTSPQRIADVPRVADMRELDSSGGNPV